MTLSHWLAMTIGFILVGLGGLKGYGRIYDWYLGRKFPEKK